MAQTAKRKLNVKKGDSVLILVGQSEKDGGDRGKKAKVIATNPKTNKIICENINIQIKHRKARSAQDTGGKTEIAGPIDASNVMVICPGCKKPTRVGITVENKGGKEKHIRICRKCGESLDKGTGAKVDKKAVKESKKIEEKPKKEKSKKSGDKQ